MHGRRELALGGHDAGLGGDVADAAGDEGDAQHAFRIMDDVVEWSWCPWP